MSLTKSHRKTPAKIESKMVKINTGQASNTDIKSFFG